MLQSHIIEIDGAFVGAAVRLDRGYRFIATDMRLDELDGSVWPTLADVQRLARQLYLSGRFSRATGPGAAAQHHDGSYQPSATSTLRAKGGGLVSY